MGNALSIIDSLPSVNINTTNPNTKTGSAVLNSIDNKYYYSNGTNWIPYQI